MQILFLPGISGGVSFFTYFPTTPSLIDLSLLFLDFIIYYLFWTYMYFNSYKTKFSLKVEFANSVYIEIVLKNTIFQKAFNI